jgi:endonuclease/exonuclease/phosphatase (EEP) superfamily protein YafD
MPIDTPRRETPLAATPQPASRPLSLSGLLSAAGCVVCLFTLMGFAGRWSWVFEITSHFRAQYAVLLVGCGLVVAWQRQLRMAAVFLAFAALNFWLLIPFLFGAPVLAATTGTPPVRLLVWNVNSANREFAELPRLLAAHDPDVVVLLEVSPPWERELGRLTSRFPERVIEARDDNFGIALLSRLPLADARVRYLGAAGFPSITADFSRGGRRFTLLATHPLPPAGELRARYRDEQLRAVARWTQEQAGEVVVTGDLNITPWSPVFADFLQSSGLRNSAEGRGLSGTWPAFFPPMRIPIDHFLHTDAVSVTRREVVKASGSDHLPLLVEFGVK